jgi:hypothetical protein
MKRPTVYEGLQRLPDPPLTYADEMRRRGGWRRRPADHAYSLFWVIASMAALAGAYGIVVTL